MKRIILVAGMLLINLSVHAQLPGLWEVTKVEVGEEEMTPIAKWTHIHEDGSFTSGNGWLQNSDGTWNFNSETKQLSVTTITGFEDSYGPFTVEINGNNEMIWSREEDGNLVRVTNKRIEVLPKHPATLAVGIWAVKEVLNKNEEVTEEYLKENAQVVFLRWDNLFREFSAEGRINGIWRVNAHRPVVDILFYNEDRALEYWGLDFPEQSTMIWKRDELTIKYQRLKSFPE